MDVALGFIIAILTAAYGGFISKSIAAISILIVLVAYFLVTNKEEKPLSLERDIEDLESELKWVDSKRILLESRFVREKSGALPGIWLLLCLIGFILVLIPSGAAKTMADGGNSLRMAFFVALIGAGVLAWAWGTLEERIANNTVPSLEQRATLLKALICAKRGEDRSEDVAPEDKDMKKLIEGVEKFEAWRKKFLAERQEKRLAAQKRTQQQS